MITRTNPLLSLLLLASCQAEHTTQSETLRAVSTQPSTGASLAPTPAEPPYSGPLEPLYRAQDAPNRQSLAGIPARTYAKIVKSVFPKGRLGSKPCVNREGEHESEPALEAPSISPLLWYTAEGSFTEPNAKQTLYLMDARECGEEPGTTIVAIFDDLSSLVGTFISKEYRWISRVLDINQDGLSEILFYEESSNEHKKVALFGKPNKAPSIEFIFEKSPPSRGFIQSAQEGELFQRWADFLVYSYKEPIYGLPTEGSSPPPSPRPSVYQASVYYRPFQEGAPLVFVVR